MTKTRRTAQLAAITDRVHQYTESAEADNTRRAYDADWRDFSLWCDTASLAVLPAAPETVAAYLVTLADGGLKSSTINRRAAAIAARHVQAEYESPTTAILVKKTLAGIRRRLGTAQRGKAPAVTDDVRAMVTHLPDTVGGLRDRALLLIGFAGAFRRSELVALNVDDITWTPDGMKLFLARGKTDQEGAGRWIGIPFGEQIATCPVRAVRAWLDATNITEEAIFREVTRHGEVKARLTGHAVARIVKRAALAAGLDPTRYSGHSLRAGFVTTAAANGVSEFSIMQQTGHRSLETARRYIRDGSLFRDNPAKKLGL